MVSGTSLSCKEHQESINFIEGQTTAGDSYLIPYPWILGEGFLLVYVLLSRKQLQGLA